MYESGSSPGRSFEHETLAFLGALVTVTAGVFYAVDHELNAIDHTFDRLGSERLADYLGHFHRLDPLHPRRFAQSDRNVVTIEEALPLPALERSSYYRDFLLPLGARHEVELYLRDGMRIVGGISLLRGAGHPSFTAGELALLAKARPYVEHAYGLERRIAITARDVGGLTPRESDVVHLVCGGASNAAVARELGIALPTVKTHLEHVYAKLGVRTRAQLVARLALARRRH